VPLSSETAEKVDSAGRDSVGANSRRPYSPSEGFDDVVEGNLLRRNGPPDQASDFSAVSSNPGTFVAAITAPFRKAQLSADPRTSWRG
jgi:hypothetical protein